MRPASPNSHHGVSLLGPLCGVDARDCSGLTLRPCSGQADGEPGGWAWGCGETGEVAPVGVSGAEGEEGVALGGVDGREEKAGSSGLKASATASE